MGDKQTTSTPVLRQIFIENPEMRKYANENKSIWKNIPSGEANAISVEEIARRSKVTVDCVNRCLDIWFSMGEGPVCRSDRGIYRRTRSDELERRINQRIEALEEKQQRLLKEFREMNRKIKINDTREKR